MGAEKTYIVTVFYSKGGADVFYGPTFNVSWSPTFNKPNENVYTFQRYTYTWSGVLPRCSSGARTREMVQRSHVDTLHGNQRAMAKSQLTWHVMTTMA